MKIQGKVLDSRVADFQKACVRRGLKLTYQRIEIYRTLASSDEHPDVEMIYRRVRKRIPTISQDTVYRNLKLLAGQDLISVVGMSHDRSRFDANMGPHHHFVCRRCGMIRDFFSPRLGAVEPPKEARIFGIPESVQLEVKGICRDCRSQVPGNR